MVAQVLYHGYKYQEFHSMQFILSFFGGCGFLVFCFVFQVFLLGSLGFLLKEIKKTKQHRSKNYVMVKKLVSLVYKDFIKCSEYVLVSCSGKLETLQMTSDRKAISIKVSCT